MHFQHYGIFLALSWLPQWRGVKLQEPNYSLFAEDLAYYENNFKAYLPDLATNDIAADLVLFLPVSYHLNPANYPNFVQRHMCKEDTNLTWHGALPTYQFCGFTGRKCYHSDEDCLARCATDIEQAFGKPAQTPLESNLRTSAYFAWYSKRVNQPIFSGYWTRPILKKEGWNPCEAQPDLCDLTCKDAGGVLAGSTGCEGDRACGTFATCDLGNDMIAQRWNDIRPTGAETEESCESQGYSWTKKWGCQYTALNADCEAGRCYDRGHVVPSGAIGQFYGRSGQTFTMCNVAGMTAFLNECQWMFVEAVAECAGRFYKILTFSGSTGPFAPSERMSKVPTPASLWKLLLIPRSEFANPETDKDTCFLWILNNSHNPPIAEYANSSYRGVSGLAEVEAELGFEFPDMIRNCYFPSTCSVLATSILDDAKISMCGFVPYDLDQFSPNVKAHEIYSKAGPYNVLENCKGISTPYIPCPDHNIKGRKGIASTTEKPQESGTWGWWPEIIVGCFVLAVVVLCVWVKRPRQQSRPVRGALQTELTTSF
mmetsp:Transcript_405/g.613  ORF Transcript_405/g.613 Transcript_405/m.613 type:complete len:541 (+) Transcript_405:58-1680(+)